MTSADLLSLLSSLDSLVELADKENALKSITQLWSQLRKSNIPLTAMLKENNILITCANVMKENYTVWTSNWPPWVDDLLYLVRLERDYEQELYSLDQIKILLEVFQNYLLAGNVECLLGFRHLGVLQGVRKLLLNNEAIYTLVTKGLNKYQLRFLNCIAGSFEWKLKLISDTDLVAKLLLLSESVELWNLLINIAKHPDAKTLLPTKDIIAKASKSTYIRCTELCALLCNESDLMQLELRTDWLELMGKVLRQLIEYGTAAYEDGHINLLVPILPIVNLSTVDSQKGPLGKLFVPLFIQIVTHELPVTIFISPYVDEGRREASRALWNFAYLQSNCDLIVANNGIALLNATVTKTQDSILKHNIMGVLHMLSLRSEHSRGHVMISYNWGNQAVVKRLSKSLQEYGYNVWLDIEQMSGSTLDAMSSAIEKAETVLLCMSQKYKDSPNCRLEGEYCVNRRVKYIPLLMQKSYQPDGWLGIMLGAKLYYDFTDEDDWDHKMSSLIKAIGEHSRLEKPIARQEETLNSTTHNWIDEDLLRWMKREGIDHHFALFKLHKLNKRALMELQKPKYHKHPNFLIDFFKELGVKEYGEILQLCAAICSVK